MYILYILKLFTGNMMESISGPKIGNLFGYSWKYIKKQMRLKKR